MPSIRMNTPMERPRRWRRAPRRGVAEIIGAVLLVGLTLTAGIILWSFRLNQPPPPPTVLFKINSGGANPVWGDPTDCQPKGNWSYPLASSLSSSWTNQWWNQCEFSVSGNFSLMNTSQIIVSATSPSNIPLTQINLTFVCDGALAPAPYTRPGTTVLVSGSLAAMTWFPGSTSSPAPNAPRLGSCGGFNAGGFGGGAFGTLYNRLAVFVPISANSSVLQSGDTFILYIHNGGWPLDYACVTNGQPWGGVGSICPNGIIRGPLLDVDDYHGAPPWCFTNPAACTIYLTYTGTPSTLLATIPVYSLAPPTSG